MSVFRAGGMRSVSKQLAHTTILPALGNKDLKLLQDLITAEKFVVASAQRLADDLAKASDALKSWGAGEGEDLGDVLSKSRELLILVSAAFSQFSTHETAIRVHMKDVRTREENLDDMRRRRKQVGTKAEAAEKKLSKMGSEHKQLPMQTDLLHQLQNEMRQLDSQILVEEARIGDYKRQTTKDWMALKFGGLAELAQKTMIVGDTGKQLIEEIPLEQTQPGYGRVQYVGHEQTQQLLDNASRAIADVTFQPTTGNLPYHYEGGQPQPQSPTHTGPGRSSGEHPHHGRFPGGLPPGPEPHRQGSMPQPGMPAYGASPEVSFDRSYDSQNSQFGEFGQQPPGQASQSQSLFAPRPEYPARTTSSTTGGPGYSTMPNRSGWNLQDTGPSMPMPTPPVSSAKEEAPLPSIPPPDAYPSQHPRDSVRRSASGLSDTGADMVLAYYSTQDGASEDGPSHPGAGPAAPLSPSHTDDNPYAEDAYKVPSPAQQYPSHQHPGRQQSLGLVDVKPLRPRSIQSATDLKAADAAAAREIGKELDQVIGVTSNPSTPSTTTVRRPPPRSSSKSAMAVQEDLRQAQQQWQEGPYHQANYTDHEPHRADTQPPTLSLSFGPNDEHFDIPGFDSPTRTRGDGMPPRQRSPPPSFEVATGTPLARETPLPATTDSRALSVESEHSLPRSSSNLSTASSLSTLPPPNAPFRSVSPSRGTTTSMPSSPVDASSPKTISAAAFKKFRGPSASPADVKRKAPPLMEQDSSGSGITQYASAQTSPTMSRLPSEVRAIEEVAGRGDGYHASPLSVPPYGNQLDGGNRDLSRISYMSEAPAPFEGDPATIGMAMGSPATPEDGGRFVGHNNRMTIGDAGWKPAMPGRMPTDTPLAAGPNDNRGYGSGRFATNLE